MKITDDKRMFKMSLLLGIAVGGLKAMHATETGEDVSQNELFSSMERLITRLEKGVDELFYNEDVD